MKVFFLGRYNTTEYLTGPEKVAKRIFNEFTKYSESVFIEYFFDGRKFGLIKKLFGNDNIVKVNSSKVLRMGMLRLFYFLLKEKPSTIHIITFERFSAVCFFYKIFFRTNIIYGLQGISYYENIKYKNVSLMYTLKDKICESLLLRYSDKLVFLSEKSAQIAAEYFNFDPAKIEIIPNGVDEIFYEKGRTKIFTNSGPLKIVFIGNIERKEKGFEFLKASLIKVNFPFELYLLCNNKKFTENNFVSVPILDTNSLAQFLNDKDIYISASEYEPFSIAAAECISEGLVTIATEETGMSRYIVNGSNGYTVKFNDSKELIRILNFINSNKDSLSVVSTEGKKIYDEVSWSSVLSKYQEFYK